MENCIKYLEIADLVSAVNLREEALSVLVNNLGDVVATDDYRTLAQTNRSLLEKIFTRIQDIKSLEMLFVSAI